ncbi:MAG: type II toxin-antitoxin system RelE/ParE family toxin [Balneolaceae bacterium]|nr:type II toxin-antitoxin system RelE/ParE family toxin [Balneolaceae bacterium]
MKIRFFEAAYTDLEKSKNYFEEIDPALADYFMRDIKHALESIRKFPESGPQHASYKHLRLKTCQRFPFSIIYHKQEQEQIIMVIAVAHHKRNPDFWQKRLDQDS